MKTVLRDALVFLASMSNEITIWMQFCRWNEASKMFLTLFVFNYPIARNLIVRVNFHRFDFVKHVLIARWFSVFARRLIRAELLSTAKPAMFFLGLAWRIQTTASLFAVVRRKNQFCLFKSNEPKTNLWKNRKKYKDTWWNELRFVNW